MSTVGLNQCDVSPCIQVLKDTLATYLTFLHTKFYLLCKFYRYLLDLKLKFQHGGPRRSSRSLKDDFFPAALDVVSFVGVAAADVSAGGEAEAAGSRFNMLQNRL